MTNFILWFAPVNRLDFAFKLVLIVLLCGLLNWARDLLIEPDHYNGLLQNIRDAMFVAVPMCTLGLAFVTHLHDLHRRMERLLLEDQLTGLANRRWFFENSPQTFHGDHTLVLIDIDFFKKVNDSYGHAVGDQCLVSFARHLETILPKGTRAARLGGEEFAVVFSDTSPAVIFDCVARIVAGTVVDVAGMPRVKITTSAGVTSARTLTDLNAVLAVADQALYMAKANGRAQYVNLLDAGQDVEINRQSTPFRAAAAFA